MEYDLLNNSLLGSVAFEPCCLNNEVNLYAKFPTHTSDGLVTLSDYDLYFNGLNSSNLNSAKLLNDTNPSIFNDIDLNVFTNDSYSLDHLDLLEDGSAATSPESNNFINYNIDMDKSALPSPISSVGSSVDDISFDLLESLATDEVIDEKPRSRKFQSFQDLETPLSSPGSSSDDDMEMIDLLAFADTVLPPLSPEPSNTENIILTEHMYAKTPLYEFGYFDISPAPISPESDYHVTCFDDFSSPKSVDSGISSASSYDEGSDGSEDLFSELLKDQLPQHQYESGVGKIVINKHENTANPIRYAPYKEIKEKSPEQKQRKKKQNRNAASKYRTKKKDEQNTVFTEVEGLEAKNKELKGSVEGMRKEIDYLKNLMLDVIKARLSKKNVGVNLETLMSGLVKQAC